MTILVTCNYDWDHQFECGSEKEARAWMATHAEGKDTEHKNTKGDNEFRLWYHTDDGRVILDPLVQMKNAEAKDGWK